MKKLTQADFKDAPNWVESASINSDGTCYFHNMEKSLLMPYQIEAALGVWDMNYIAPEPNYIQDLVGIGYDTTDWQNSAIDREVKTL